MVKNIQELCDKLEKREDKRLTAGKDFNFVHSLLSDSLRHINECSSDIYKYYMLSQKEFCVGFLYGLFSSHCITKEEFGILHDELMSVHDSYLQRCAQETAERNGTLSEDFDFMSLGGGVAL